MKKIKIIEIHTANRNNAYNYLVQMLEAKESSDWTEVDDEEFKTLSSSLSKKSNYLLIELHDKNNTILNVKQLLENMKKEQAARKEAEKLRSLKMAEQKRKEALAKEAKKKIALDKKLERARKLLADAGQL